MGAIASRITNVSIVFSTVCSGADQRKYQSSASLAFVSGECLAQSASYAENVSISWRHHVIMWNVDIYSRKTLAKPSHEFANLFVNISERGDEYFLFIHELNPFVGVIQFKYSE